MDVKEKLREAAAKRLTKSKPNPGIDETALDSLLRSGRVRGVQAPPTPQKALPTQTDESSVALQSFLERKGIRR